MGYILISVVVIVDGTISNTHNYICVYANLIIPTLYMYKRIYQIFYCTIGLAKLSLMYEMWRQNNVQVWNMIDVTSRRSLVVRAAVTKSGVRGFESHIGHDGDFSTTGPNDTGSMGRSSHWPRFRMRHWGASEAIWEWLATKGPQVLVMAGPG